MSASPPAIEYGFSLGSNLGDRLANLSAARQALLAAPGARLLAASPVYETEPVGVKPEFAHLAFLNAVLVVASPEPPEAWLQRLHDIEYGMGRERGSDRNAPRHIDVDILYAGDACIGSAGLSIPHPRWALRRFVVQPLADVRPQLRLPGLDRRVAEVLAALPPGEAVTPFATDW